MQKRKNDTSYHKTVARILLMIGISAALIFGLLSYVYIRVQRGDGPPGLEKTAQAIEATNNFVATSIAQTQAASTPSLP
jgi:hypothetical protein